MAGRTKSQLGESRERPISIPASISFLKCSPALVSSAAMDDKLTPADPKDLADTVAFALRFEGRKRVHQADEYMAAIAAERVVRHLRARRLRRHEETDARRALGARARL